MREGEPSVITVYHGTHNKKAPSIEKRGLEGGSMGYNNSQWYMVATDMNSALFHATPEDEGDAVVFEFAVPVDNSKWEGYPFFWPPHERSSDSKWFALKQPIPSEYIKKVHRISNDDYRKSKSNMLNESKEVQWELQLRDIDGPVFYKRQKGEDAWKFISAQEFAENCKDGKLIKWEDKS